MNNFEHDIKITQTHNVKNLTRIHWDWNDFFFTYHFFPIKLNLYDFLDKKQASSVLRCLGHSVDIWASVSRNFTFPVMTAVMLGHDVRCCFVSELHQRKIDRKLTPDVMSTLSVFIQTKSYEIKINLKVISRIVGTSWKFAPFL